MLELCSKRFELKQMTDERAKGLELCSKGLELKQMTNERARAL